VTDSDETPAAITDPIVVSVITPILNDAARLELLLSALEGQQGAPPFEVIVVDNGSSDDLPAVAGRHSGIRLLHEGRQGSYAARNTGVAAARGAVLAFTDADCIPAADWLASGVAALEEAGDRCFVGGRVKLFAADSSRPTAAELWELQYGFPQRGYIEVGGFAATANLFVRSKTFREVGDFDANLRSGGDAEWGKRATALGVRGVYRDDVIVEHPCRRTFAEQRTKIRRTKVGSSEQRVNAGKPAFDPVGLARDIPRGLKSLVLGLPSVGPPTLRNRVLYAYGVAVVTGLNLVERARGARLASARPADRLRVLAAPARGLHKWNPFTQLLYDAVAQHSVEVVHWNFRRLFLRRWHIIHIHWPELVIRKRRYTGRLAVAMVLCIAGLRLAKRRGAKIVWTLHNLSPHSDERQRLWGWFFAQFAKLVDGVTCMSEHAHNELVAAYPRMSTVPYVVAQHGHYRDWYPPCTMTAKEARLALDLEPDVTTLLCFGNIREYKSLVPFAREFASAADAGARLVIAGDPRDRHVGDELRSIAAGDPRIHLHLRRVEEADVGTWFRAADVAVFPYSILNSGSAMLSLSFSTPIVMPQSPPASELQAIVGSDWVALAEGSMPSLLREAMATAAMTRSDFVDLEPLDWHHAGAEVVRLYRELRDQKTDLAMRSSSSMSTSRYRSTAAPSSDD
jgi:beta-1,4-mannosyltransferase